MGQPQYPPQQYPNPQYPQPQGQYPPQYPQGLSNGGPTAPSAPPMPSASWQQQPSQGPVQPLHIRSSTLVRIRLLVRDNCPGRSLMHKYKNSPCISWHAYTILIAGCPKC